MKSVITLGTPHHGTPTAVVGVALLGVGTSARDLLPRSRVVGALARDSFPADIPLTSIYSRADLVCPHWASVLRPRPGEETHMANVEVDGVGHSQLVWDPRVYRIVRDKLTEAADLWRARRAPADPAAEDGRDASTG
ncbi:MAG: hypothetical protein R3F59_15800 [Myxococcota bacterium]